MMNGMRWTGALAVAVCAVILAACERKEEGSAEQVGREIDAAMQKSAEKMGEASEKMGQAMGQAAEQMGQAANQMGEAMQSAGREVQREAEQEEQKDPHEH